MSKPPSEKRLAANRECRPLHRTAHLRGQSPLRSQFPQARLQPRQLRRRPPRGFYGTNAELDSVAKLRADAIATYRPVNSPELFAVERISLAQQSLLRCASLEAGFHTDFMNETITRDGFPPNRISEELTSDIRVTRAQNRNLCLAAGFQGAVRKSQAWKLFVRYQAQTERLYRRAVEEFERLKELRCELRNEANKRTHCRTH